ncbi:hypothetical protein IHE45_06G025500 [Dioscorea alata]|uniref:Uncharacterized protein n=1 Tax=Dioscorea alata TaxID=55571 RepID=A0ACB7VVQ2_DIOAL|nr:hypothetical protein IHE45_06G025500 [Dioscorea alata]
MDLRFRRFEERFEEIVDHLHALQIDAHRRRNDNRRPGVEVARGVPIGRRRPVPIHRQYVYDEYSEEEDDLEPNWFGCHQPYEGQRARNNYERVERDGRDFRLRVDILSFNGSLAIEEFLDWIAEIDRFFDYMETPAEKRVRLVACHLKGGASAW